MSAAIHPILEDVAWTEEPKHDSPTLGFPYVTHSGVLDLAGVKLRCYRLSDGRAILDAEDIHAFLAGIPA